jgi:superfamily II DNA or RNA helicase
MSARSVILNSNNWEQFNQNLVKLDKKEKGDAFELLTKYFFKVEPKYLDLYKEVWIHHELPIKVKKELNYFQDRGIDLIAETKSGEYHAIQCKYHSDKDKNVTLKELSTFFTNYESRDKLTVGYVCSSANDFSKNINSSVSKQLQYILSDKWQSGIDEYMWAIHKYIKDKAFNIKPYDPRDHQLKAIKEAKEHFKKESRGKLIFPCGAGKSLTGFWFTQELKSKNTLIAVPSLSLIKQTLDVYLREIVANKKKVKWLCICSDDGIGRDDDIVFKTENIGVPCQTDPEYIENWLKENKNENKIIFTTYQSGKIIAELSKKLDMSFDLGIFDEAHKTVGSSKKLFSHLLFEKNISIDRRIFMTATERFYDGQKSEDIISMDDVDIYGDTFSMMTFKEAIEAQPALLTDYKVITIDIKQSEISEFIKENRNVNFSGNWDKDIKSRSLASMLALRKAMKLFPIKNAVSFHSSIKQARLNEELQDYISDTYNYDPIDTFTVSGKIPTTKRNDIVQEFAKSDKALITNARCLTEGVDVPNIDCIVFADPRRSKVDIVQALGRALRTKKGKDWGYVILPVIYNDKTNEIDNDNFNEILSVVRGLAANDERIVDYFKFKESERIEKSKAGELIFNFEVFSEYIDESELKENLQIKLWDKLSRFQWMPFEEARKFTQSLNLKSHNEWKKYIKSLERNKYLPVSPQRIYKNKGWENWGNWLGSGNISSHKINFLSFNKAREYTRKFNLQNQQEWKIFSKTKRPNYIPSSPPVVYKNKGWLSWGDWLGTKIGWDGNYIPFEEAREYIRNLNLKSQREWINYSKSVNKPINIPKKPEIIYKDKGWISLGDWLGTGRIAARFRSYREFNKAKKFVHLLNLKSGTEWKNYSKSGNKPEDIPSAPQVVYKNKGWISMGDWLGSGRVADNLKEYLDFNKARSIVRKMNFKSGNDYLNAWRKGLLPENIPANPGKTYKNKGFVSMPDFLGYKSRWEWMPFEDAREFIKNMDLKSSKEYINAYKKGLIPKNIPFAPRTVYKNKGWISMGDWLGTGRVSDNLIKFIEFEEARKYVRCLGLSTHKQWREFINSGKKPKNIPSGADKVYKMKGWKGWADFLGKEKMI